TPPLVYAVANKRIPITNAVFLAALAFGWLDYDIIYLCPEGGYIGNPCIATDVAYLRFGPADACQLQVAVAPAEVLTSGGMAIKPAFVAPQKMFLGQTHNTLGYAVPSQEWNGSPIGRTYEETMSPTPSFGDTVVNAIISLAADDDCAVMMSP
ncbi:MAG TPA: hypothetical protein DCO77_06970, partial [Nitrospiraceae bacterium]|nr:hypothetical protein [Nitrospiraceae bacterium]